MTSLFVHFSFFVLALFGQGLSAFAQNQNICLKKAQDAIQKRFASLHLGPLDLEFDSELTYLTQSTCPWMEPAVGDSDIHDASEEMSEAGEVLWIRDESQTARSLSSTASLPATLWFKKGSRTAQATLGYRAWLKVWMPTERLYPHQALRSELFELSRINVAEAKWQASTPLFYWSKPGENFSSLEAIESLLPGEPLLRSRLRKIPDIKSGESVELKLTLGNLNLSTRATAQQSAHLGERIQVQTLQTKRIFQGILKENHRVEAHL